MTTYISLLRGINVGGHNKITMDALKQLYCELGYLNVQSYIQSGNLIFDSPNTDIGAMAHLLQDEILQNCLKTRNQFIFTSHFGPKPV